MAPRSRVQQGLAILAILLVAAIAGADWLIIASQRAASIDDFRTATTNLANGMTAQTERSLSAVDGMLRDLRGKLTAIPDPTADRIQAGLRTRTAFDLLVDRRQRLAGVDSLAIVDVDGKVVNTTRAWPPSEADLSGQDFFRHFSGEDDAAAFVGLPREDRASGKWTSVLARRINDPLGSFVGVLLAELSLSDLEAFYRTAMPVHRTITVARRDGTVLVRYPHQAEAVGSKVPQGAPWYGIVTAGGGSYVAPGYFDDVPVVAVVRPLRDLPFVIETTVTEADALAGWYRQRLWLIAGGIVACLGTILLVRLFAMQIRRLADRNLQLDDARHQLDVAMSNISQGLSFFDGRQRLIVCNRRFGEIYGLPAAAMQPDVSLADIVGCTYQAGGLVGFTRDEYMMSRSVIARSGEPHQSIVEMVDGRTIAIQQQPMPDGGWVATHEDITERRRAEEKIAFLARHDALTGLPNRSLLLERIGQALAIAARGRGFAVLFLDLDRFKAVNDTLGHATGDELLRAVTQRLLATVRNVDTVARLGGDEFVVLQAGVEKPDSAAVLAERIVKAVAAPYTIGGNEVVIGVSVGVEIATSDDVTAEDLLKNADLALYNAKREGRGTFRFFAPNMDANVQNRYALERDLRCAIARGELVLYYQPIVNARSGTACGFEALLRWRHPVRGLVPPQDFIPLAEETGLIIPIGEWVIAEACREAARWPAAIHVAVNLSPVQFSAVNLVDVVRDALASAGLPAARLELEITESVLLESNQRNVAVLNQLRACGVGIVMDDFGIGYSSLSYLRRFPFDRIKIDQSFIRDLTTTDDAVFVVRAIVGLCRDLGIRTTAEGVETAEELAILAAEGCTELQGYLFSRPKPASHLTGAIGGALLIAPRPAEGSGFESTDGVEKMES